MNTRHFVPQIRKPIHLLGRGLRSAIDSRAVPVAEESGREGLMSRHHCIRGIDLKKSSRGTAERNGDGYGAAATRDIAGVIGVHPLRSRPVCRPTARL